MKKLLKVLQAVGYLVALPILLLSLTIETVIVQVLTFIAALLTNKTKIVLFQYRATFELFKFTVEHTLKGNTVKNLSTTKSQAYDPNTNELIDWICVDRKLKNRITTKITKMDLNFERSPEYKQV